MGGGNLLTVKEQYSFFKFGLSVYSRCINNILAIDGENETPKMLLCTAFPSFQFHSMSQVLV